MRNKILALAGALLVGALGSGLWELLKPLIFWASAASLGIVTLGLDSLRDGLYADAATGDVERLSGSVLTVLIGIATGAMLAFMFLPRRPLLKEPPEPKSEDPEQLSAYRAALQGHIAKLKRFKFILVSVLLILLTWQVLMTQRAIYVSHANAHFNRLCSIASPYMSDADLKRVRSAFSQTSTRNDYLLVVGELERVIKQNGARVPSFSIY